MDGINKTLEMVKNVAMVGGIALGLYLAYKLYQVLSKPLGFGKDVLEDAGKAIGDLGKADTWKAGFSQDTWQEVGNKITGGLIPAPSKKPQWGYNPTTNKPNASESEACSNGTFDYMTTKDGKKVFMGPGSPYFYLNPCRNYKPSTSSGANPPLPPPVVQATPEQWKQIQQIWKIASGGGSLTHDLGQQAKDQGKSVANNKNLQPPGPKSDPTNISVIPRPSVPFSPAPTTPPKDPCPTDWPPKLKQLFKNACQPKMS